MASLKAPPPLFAKVDDKQVDAALALESVEHFLQSRAVLLKSSSPLEAPLKSR